MTQLNITLGSATDETLLQVDGIATLAGTLTLDVGGVADGSTLALVNATRINGAFAGVEVVQRRGSACTDARLQQDEQTLVALLYVSLYCTSVPC